MAVAVFVVAALAAFVADGIWQGSFANAAPLSALGLGLVITAGWYLGQRLGRRSTTRR